MLNVTHKELEVFEAEEVKTKRWILLALALGMTMVLANVLELLAHGFALGFTLPLTNEPATVSGIIYRVTVISIAVYVGFVGLKELVIEKKFSIEFLMAIAALGAVYLNFLFEAATVLFLYSLAEHFEDCIEDRARKTVETLSKFMPNKARIIVDASERTVDVKEIQPGTVVLVRPGERIALDGKIVEGSSSLDQSLVTGESTPLDKTVDDEVYAGTLNLNGVLKIVAGRGAQGSLVSRIARLVVESRKRKASVERLVDRFARFYIPVVISLAAFTAIALPRLVGGSFETWLYRSLILLVISCPSAFVVSVPATIFMTVTVAARKGIIVKGGVYIEKMARTRAVVFDKTGTLTLGAPVVHDIKSIQRLDDRALKYAAALEQYSNHPLAHAIVKKASQRNLDLSKIDVKEVKEIPGKGLVGYVDDVEVAVGSMQLMDDYSCSCAEINEIKDRDKHTFMCVSVAKSAIATICVTDEVRRDAVGTVKALKEAGIHTAMLTGDKTEIASEVAEGLGVDEFHAELFPEDKLRVLHQLKAKHGMIAMVGDGVNDAPALAASDVGIAMGSSGVDVALESADVVLVKDKLTQIPYLMRLSDKTVTIAKQNIVASLAVKILLGALGLLGLVPLWFTVASGDDGLTLLVLLNTLRLQGSGSQSIVAPT